MPEGGVIVSIDGGPWQWYQDVPTAGGAIGASGKIWCKWGTTNFTFGNSPYKWSQPCTKFAIEILRHTGGPEPERNVGDWINKHPERKKRFIQLLCIIEGKEYKEREYERENVSVTVSDVKLIAKHVLGIDVDIEVSIDESSIKQI